MKRMTIGIVAHVDAGKTTLSEQMLVRCGIIATAGSVDKGDTMLDYDEQEKERGITIYAKEAHMTMKRRPTDDDPDERQDETEVYVIDTPGHADFSSEMERALQVLDLAVILINAQDGVQSHTETIWKCLEHYRIPAVVFVNKMDLVQAYKTTDELLDNLKQNCSDQCIDWLAADRDEQLGVVNEDLMNAFFEGSVPLDLIQQAVYGRQCFPVIFGSAKLGSHVDDLMNLIVDLSYEKEYGEEFGALVYKITSDEGTRLTHLKITSGRLAAKQKFSEEDKIDQIRLYQGRTFSAVGEAEAGMVVAVKGLKNFEAGSGMGIEEGSAKPLLNAYMSYTLLTDERADKLALARVLHELADEDPTLDIEIDEKTKRIQVRIMGQMQIEVLRRKILERCGIEAAFGAGNIIYAETIAAPVEGYGHFEPLRHYAEVHVRLEPLPRGRGIETESEVSRDYLPMHFQKSILSALARKRHRGVLTGSPLTDVKIILTAGKGSNKHTEGGDFFQASQRAVRQGLMKAENVLLEPWCSYELIIPSASLSRALFELETFGCTMETQDLGSSMKITGKGPLRLLMHYQNDVTAYTKGRGRFQVQPEGYDVCTEAEKIVGQLMYDPEADLRNPAGSVFCAHGAGYYVPWYEVEDNLHIDIYKGASGGSYKRVSYTVAEDNLLDLVAAAGSRNRNEHKKVKEKPVIKKEKPVEIKHLPPCLIVDGYNMIYAWDEFAELARVDIQTARERLTDLIFNYQGYTGDLTILVFDGYRVKENQGSVFTRGNMMVVYTKADVTADAYIEKATFDMRKRYSITVATSDALVQNAAFAHGALRMSARELKGKIDLMNAFLAEKGVFSG